MEIFVGKNGKILMPKERRRRKVLGEQAQQVLLKVKEKIEQEKKNDEQQAEVIRRKRGRPRKNLVEQQVEAPKRKRGRPRKNLVKQQAETPKRKRGRSRKNLVKQKIVKVTQQDVISENVATVNVHSQFGVEEKGKQEILSVHRFLTEPAKVAVDYSMTVNLGNYQSLKIGVLVSVPCYKEEIDKCFNFVSDYVKNRLNKELINAVPSLDIPFQEGVESSNDIKQEDYENKADDSPKEQ